MCAQKPLGHDRLASRRTFVPKWIFAPKNGRRAPVFSTIFSPIFLCMARSQCAFNGSCTLGIIKMTKSTDKTCLEPSPRFELSGRTKKLGFALAAGALAAALGGCVMLLKWRVTTELVPKNFNQVLLDRDGNAAHVYMDGGVLHVAKYGDKGVALGVQDIAATITNTAPTLDLDKGRLLVRGATLGDSVLIDANLGTAGPLDAAQLPVGASTWALANAKPVLNGKIALYGTRTGEEGGTHPWLMLWDLAAGSFTLVETPMLDTIDAVFAQQSLMVQGQAAGVAQVVTLDATLNVLGQFAVPAGQKLIGDSLGRPVLYNDANLTLYTVNFDGTPVWTYKNETYKWIRGQRVGPDGSVLLYGDHSNYSAVALRKDSAHFLRVTPEGALAYHYQTLSNDTARIDYKNIRQFADGSMQISLQGLSGDVTGLLIFDGVVGVPYQTKKTVRHEFISAAGKESRYVKEPIRVEVISQTKPLLIELLSSQGGHCASLDVYNVGKAGLLTLNELCGAEKPSVVLSRY
ncbi:hypothetical protein HDN1F_05880 [gamma proteobacterium HdN1]|nr:hypothetical protein HDN1F_05880 [gamma proteobacterium HdN1]